MKFDKRKDINPKYLLLTLSIICVILLILSVTIEDSISSIKSYTNYIISPMQKGINKIGNWYEEELNNFEKIDDLQAENKELLEELNQYKADVTKYELELIELSELRKLYDLDEKYPNYEKTIARVFAKNSSAWFNDFYIDKGLDDGLNIGCNVLCDNGLTGIIIDCNSNTSRIRAIIDDQTSISASILPSNALCTVNGSLINITDGYIVAYNIDKDAAIEIGNKVVTSDISDRYLPGITIGFIEKIEDDLNNLTVTVYITPTVDFSNISEVLVIKELKNTSNNLEE